LQLRAILYESIRQSGEPVAILDPDGRLLHANAAWQSAFGEPLAGLVGHMPFGPRNESPGKSEAQSAVWRQLESGRPWRGELHRTNRLGSPIVQDAQLAAVSDPAGGATWYVASLRRGSRRNDTDASLTEQITRSDMAMEGSGDGLWDVDLPSELVWLSRRLAKMIGHSGDAMLDVRAAAAWLCPEDLPRIEAAIEETSPGKPHFDAEFRLRRSDGTLFWVNARGAVLRDQSGRVMRVSGALRDIQARKERELALVDRANHDELTGLHNRGWLHSRLKEALQLRENDNESSGFAVMFLDLDRFKLVNDSLGHHAGDRLLGSLSRRLAQCVRPGDSIARLGGDEFAVLVNGVLSADSAIRVAERVLSAMKSPFRIGELEVFVSGTIGIALSDAGFADAEDMLRAADTAMYHAKSQGPGSVSVFRRGMRSQARPRLHLESELHHALDRNEMELSFQPQVRLNDGVLVGFEALLGWRHPERGLLLPGEFIGIAEETGLIVDLGRWVFDRACQEAATWPAPPGDGKPPWLAVNLSPRQFAQPDIVEQLSGSLLRSGMNPRRMRLEIVESSLVDEGQGSSVTLERVKALGLRVDVDDFGKGYSSLSYLTRLPLDGLKVDGSFVAAVTTSEPDRKVVQSMVTLAHGLGLEVTAECVENLAQLEFLRTLGCDLAQGYLFARPMSGTEAKHWIRRAAGG
jgi:diguanylate cyclase (GGDEF)-like protein/PAS domain S-box-containing protein